MSDRPRVAVVRASARGVGGWGLIPDRVTPKGPVTQHSTSKARSKSYENPVDVVERGNF